MLSRGVSRRLLAAQNTQAICEGFRICRLARLNQTILRVQASNGGPRSGLARLASSASSARWKTRQGNDSYTRDAKLAGLKSRAAFKLLEINDRYKLFRRGDTVVDLGYAPGSWSQVAVNRTAPGGRVIGIDVIPAQPPRGVSTIQGNFLSPEIRAEVRDFVLDPLRGRPRDSHRLATRQDEEGGATQDDLEQDDRGIIELEKAANVGSPEPRPSSERPTTTSSQHALDAAEGRVVNVVLSDMCEPWPLATSTWVKSVNNPFRRMMNTSGMAFRDHAGSMDLCLAALEFCYDTLATGGNFLCKFYQGAEDHALEMRLKKLFEKVHRIKPDSSRKESKEAYLVGLKRKAGVGRELVLGDM
ncbi:2' O-ribose methyltransferase [Recurvomyces mirabilis]|nr:2' O-ribose methyltransferase [Recurvomyces mirabilis]